MKEYREIYAGWLGEGVQWQIWYIAYEAGLQVTKTLKCSDNNRFFIQLFSIMVMDSFCSLSRALADTSKDPVLKKICPNLMAAGVFFVADEAITQDTMIFVPVSVGASHWIVSKAMQVPMCKSVISAIESMIMAFGYYVSMMIADHLPKASENVNPFVILPFVSLLSFFYNKIIQNSDNNLQSESPLAEALV